MFCGKCGEKIIEGDQFCRQCGAKVSFNPSPTTPLPGPVGSPEQSLEAAPITALDTTISHPLPTPNQSLQNSFPKPRPGLRAAGVLLLVYGSLMFISQVDSSIRSGSRSVSSYEACGENCFIWSCLLAGLLLFFPRTRNGGRILALVLAWWLPVATAIFAYLTPRMVGMFICMNMIFSVPLFILLWGNKDPKSCITKRRYRASWATLIGGFLMMIVLMIAMSAIESRKSRDKAEYLKMRESIVELFEQFATDLKNDQANAPNFDIAPRAKGEAGKAERWIRTFFYKVAQTRFEYYKAMAAAGSDEVTDFRNLKSPGVLQQRIQTAQKCLQLSVDYKNTIINLFDSNQKEIQTLDLKPEFRDGFQRGWNKSLGDGSAIRELSSYAPASWELFVQQLQLLARNPNHWNVEKNQIIFINHEDLIAFNANAKKIQMLQAKIGDSKNRTLAHGQELITDIKGLK